MKLSEIAHAIMSLLASDLNATVQLTVEITADFPNGASNTIKRGAGTSGGLPS